MKTFITRWLGLIALTALVCSSTVFAETTEPAEDPYTDVDTITVNLEGSINDDGFVDLSWNMYEGTNLLWYKVVHSQTNPNPKYPIDGYIKAIGTQLETHYTHTGIQEGTNYYSVCVITTNSLRGCSNTLTFEVAQAPEEIIEEVKEEVKSSDPYTDDESIVVTVTGKLNSLGKAELQWSEYNGGDLKWYKIVHSQTTSNAYYPVHGYIEVFSSPEQTFYRHTLVPEGINYYRICVITDDNRRGCSNTVTLTKYAPGAQVVNEETGFDDIEFHWAKQYVVDLAIKEIVEGTNGSFEPDRPILRSEAIKMTMYGFGYDDLECDDTLFPDLESDDWFCGIVTKAHIKGFVNGVNGMLLPFENINRAEAIKLLLSIKGVKITDVPFRPFSDVETTIWYAPYVFQATLLGYIDGISGLFEPSRDITRAELAKILSLAIS